MDICTKETYQEARSRDLASTMLDHNMHILDNLNKTNRMGKAL